MGVSLSKKQTIWLTPIQRPAAAASSLGSAFRVATCRDKGNILHRCTKDTEKTLHQTLSLNLQANIWPHNLSVLNTMACLRLAANQEVSDL